MFTMKVITLSALMLLASSVAWGETACRTVDYPDHTEVICNGDEKSVPDRKASSTAMRAIVHTAVQQVPIAATPVTPPAPAKAQAAYTATPPVPEAASQKHRETAAEHLAKRKAHALRNTAVLTNATSLASPVVPGAK